MRLIAFAFAAAVLTGLAPVAQAQVIKCTDARTGKVTYSNVRCESGESARIVEPERTPAEIAQDRQRTAEALARKSREHAADAARERSEWLARQQAAAAVLPQDRASSYECRQAQRDHETVSSSITGTPEQRRNRINASTVRVNAACGMQTELVQAPARVHVAPARRGCYQDANAVLICN